MGSLDPILIVLSRAWNEDLFFGWGGGDVSGISVSQGAEREREKGG